MRLIDAHALIDEMNEMWKSHPAVWENSKILSFDAVITLIGAAPVLEAKPVVHAHWVTDFDFDPEEEQKLYFYFCSKCKNELFGDKENFEYCPYCGVQMDKKEGE